MRFALITKQRSGLHLPPPDDKHAGLNMTNQTQRSVQIDAVICHTPVQLIVFCLRQTVQRVLSRRLQPQGTQTERLAHLKFISC